MNTLKSLVAAAAILSSTAAFSQVVPDDYPQSIVASAVQQQSGNGVNLVNNGSVRPWDPEGHPAFVSYEAPKPTRAAVVNDRREWQASGLAALAGAGEPQFATPAYQQKLSRYHQAGAAAAGE